MIKLKDSNKGNISNIISMLSYAFYPAFLMAFGFLNKSDNTFEKIVMSGAIVAAKELFTFGAFVLINGIPHTFKAIKKHMTGKYGVLAVAAGTLGGPVGFLFLTIGVSLIGASSPDAIVLSLAIVISLSIERVLFKKKANKKQLIGIALTIIGAIGLLALQQQKTGWSSELLIGMGFALGGAFAWGGEAVLADYVMKNNKTQMNSKNFLSIKLFSSSIISFVIMFILSGTFTQNNLGFETYKIFFTNIEFLWKIVLVGFSMVIARYAFFYGIDKTSSFISTTVITMQIVVIPIFLLIFDATSSVAVHQSDADLIYDYKFWLISISMSVGAILASLTYKGRPLQKRG